MIRKIFIVSFLLFSQSHVNAFTLDLKEWKQINGKHFKIYFRSEVSENLPREILNKAEGYYLTIADYIGYGRYQNFWTWDERVSIIYFSSQEEFALATKQPIWSKGFSVSHLSSVNLRMIVTFKGQEDFLITTLPHEVGHLILHDFIGPKRSIPLWFDEGVAQLAEKGNESQFYKKTFAQLVRNGQSIPLTSLHSPDLADLAEGRYSSIFYAESLYIVDFLIKTYGKADFIDLCRHLRDGKDFNEALRSVYYPTIDSIDKLQSEWVKHMMQYF